jgi:hypothetical protein
LFRHEVKREDHTTRAQALHKQVAFWLRVHASIQPPSVWSRIYLFATSAIPHNNMNFFWHVCVLVFDLAGTTRGTQAQMSKTQLDRSVSFLKRHRRYSTTISLKARVLETCKNCQLCSFKESQQLLARYEAHNPLYLDAPLLYSTPALWFNDAYANHRLSP